MLHPQTLEPVVVVVSLIQVCALCSSEAKLTSSGPVIPRLHSGRSALVSLRVCSHRTSVILIGSHSTAVSFQQHYGKGIPNPVMNLLQYCNWLIPFPAAKLLQVD